MSRLTAEAQNKIRRLVESGRIRSGVTVVVVNSIFTDILRAWMAKPGAPPKDEILILACDAQAEEIWAKEGIAVVAHVTDGSLWDLFSKRHEVIAVLCEAGVDAFHSDADAFWLRDPPEILPEPACGPRCFPRDCPASRGLPSVGLRVVHRVFLHAGQHTDGGIFPLRGGAHWTL
jgi:hypothetical protein